MPRFRWQLRLRTILILVAVAALLTSSGLWAAKMRRRYLTNRQRAPLYNSITKLIDSMMLIYQDTMVSALQTLSGQSPDDAIPQIKALNDGYVRLAKRKAQYEYAATHPWGPILSDDVAELRFDSVLKRQVGRIRLPDDPEPRAPLQVCRALKILPELDPRLRSSITRLWLADSDVTDEALESLRALPNLQGLNLGNTDISDFGLTRLEPLVMLRRLNLHTTHVSDAGLPHLLRLTHLETLDLSYTSVTNQGLRYVQRLPNLKTLLLRGTEISDEGMCHLEAMPELTSVDLTETKITDAGLRALGHIKKLKQVNLDEDSFSPAAIENLMKQKPDLVGGPILEPTLSIPPPP